MPNTFRYRVLIVDDDPIVRHLGTTMLESQGYEVHTAEDGFFALAALKRSPPDLIVSDLRMPNMNGFEFLSVIRHRFPLIPVIVISGEFSGSSVPESVLADAFFSKAEFAPEGLFKKTRELLHEIPARSKTARSKRAAVWVKKDKGFVAVTCNECLRTFPVSSAASGYSKAECIFCSSSVEFEILPDEML